MTAAAVEGNAAVTFKTADLALAFIAGERQARSLLDRIDRAETQPGALASMLASLSAGPMFDGATREIEKVLEGRHRG